MKPEAADVAARLGYILCPDVTFRPLDGGVLASNWRARRHVWLSMSMFSALAGAPFDGDLKACDRTRFSNVDGLLADPTGFADPNDAKPTSFDQSSAAFEYLFDRFILIRTESDYAAYFSKKKSLIDRRHFGTFHQQLGVELRLKQKVDPTEWWLRQKFNPETGTVRDNLYRFVQEAFLERYMETMDLCGKVVLDFGCGPGLAAKEFCRRGARVIGIDPDPALLARAASAVEGPFTTIRLPLDESDPLSCLPDEPLDLIWLGDVWMFYFYPPDGGPSSMAPSAVLKRLTAGLKPGGLCVIMQPHGVFWLSPWIGAADRPYTVLTEYANRLYSVVPSLEEISEALEDAGLVIRRIYEPKPVPPSAGADPRSYHFAREFPVWWVFECARR